MSPPSFWPREVIDEVVRYGYEVLRMQDAAMGRELGLTRERVRQIRARVGIVLPRCACGLKRLSAGYDCCRRCAAKMNAKSVPCSAGCGRNTWRGRPSGKCAICGNHEYYAESPERRAKHSKYSKRYRSDRLGNRAAEPQRAVGYRAALEAIRLWPAGGTLTTRDITREIARRHPSVALIRQQLFNAITEAKRQGEIEVLSRQRGVGGLAVYRRRN